MKNIINKKHMAIAILFATNFVAGQSYAGNYNYIGSSGTAGMCTNNRYIFNHK